MKQIITDLPRDVGGEADQRSTQAEAISGEIIRLLESKKTSIRVATLALEMAACSIQDLRISFPYVPESAISDLE